MKIVKYIVITLLATASSLFVLGLLNPTIEFEDKIEVESSASRAFATFFDPLFIKKWCPQVVDIKHLEGLPFTQGSKEKCVINLGYGNEEFIAELIDFEPFKKAVLNIENERFSGELKMSFFQNGKKTVVSYSHELAPKNIFYRALFALSKGFIQKKSSQAFQQYKLVAEA